MYKDTGGQRLIGCLELQVIFRKKATNYSALLWTTTYKDKTSYGSPPPCIQICSLTCEAICVLDGCIQTDMEYGVATISRLLQIIGLFCRISSRL